MPTREQINTDAVQGMANKSLSAPVVAGGTSTGQAISGATISASALASSILNACTAAADPTVPLGLATKQYVDSAAPPVPTASGMPTGYILSHVKNNATLPLTDIDFSGGSVARAFSDDDDIRLLATLTKKADAPWAAGSGVGGLFTGSFALATTYHLFLIYDPVGLVVDAGFDIDVNAANRPVAFTKYRRVASLRTPDGAASWPAFVQRGTYFRLLNSLVAFNSTMVSTAGTLVDMKIPTQLKLQALFNVGINAVATATAEGYASDPAVTDEMPAESTNPCGNYGQAFQGSAGRNATFTGHTLMTDTLARIRFRNTGDTPVMTIIALGWFDDRTQGLIPGDV